MRLHCYNLAPIDFWGLCVPWDDYLSSLFADEPDTSIRDLERAKCVAMFEAAKKLAGYHGWEGDLGEGAFVFGLPADDGTPYLLPAFVWKQSRGGWTFVVSPFPLTWLPLSGTCEIEVEL